MEILGRGYELPAPIGLTNSAWLRGYPTPQPTTLIVTGLDFSRPALFSLRAAKDPPTVQQS